MLLCIEIYTLVLEPARGSMVGDEAHAYDSPIANWSNTIAKSTRDLLKIGKRSSMFQRSGDDYRVCPGQIPWSKGCP